MKSNQKQKNLISQLLFPFICIISMSITIFSYLWIGFGRLFIPMIYPSTFERLNIYFFIFGLTFVFFSMVFTSVQLSYAFFYKFIYNQKQTNGGK